VYRGFNDAPMWVLTGKARMRILPSFLGGFPRRFMLCKRRHCSSTLLAVRTPEQGAARRAGASPTFPMTEPAFLGGNQWLTQQEHS